MPYPTDAQSPADAVASFLKMKGGQRMPTAEDYGDPTLSQGSAASPFEQQIAQGAARADAAQRDRLKTVQSWLDQLDPTQQAAAAQVSGRKIAEAKAVPETQAAGQLAVEKAKLEGAKQTQERSIAFAREAQQGQGGTGLAGGQQMTTHIDPSGGMALGFTADKTAQQIQTQQHTAQIGLSLIPTMRSLVDTANARGLTGPVAGRYHSALMSTGLSGLMMSPEDGRMWNDLEGQLKLLKSNLATVHGGARAGASPGLLARFDELLNTHQDPNALRGGIDAAERWLTAYSAAKDSSELDAADRAIGVEPGAAYAGQTPGGQGAAPNPYSGPGWQ